MRTLSLQILSVALPAQPAKDLWTAIEPIYAKTLQHPFLTGLTDGTLPKERFTFYLQQDAAYLDAFSQALLDLAAKAPNKQWADTLRRHAKEAIAQRANAKDLFIKSARYEYQFWDMAFRQEPWLP